MTTRWGQVLAVGVALGLAALATNVPLDEYAGGSDAALTVRLIASKLVNSGTAWAGLGVLAGWLATRHRNMPSRGEGPAILTPRALTDAALAAVVASELALVVHYAVGQAIGHFDAGIWWANKSWFVAAVVLGVPMGGIGAAAHRVDAVGVIARLVVPAGALIEPVLRGFFHTAPGAPAAMRTAATVSGAALVAAGVIGAATVVVTARHRRRDPVVGATHYTRRHG